MYWGGVSVENILEHDDDEVWMDGWSIMVLSYDDNYLMNNTGNTIS